ncbi:MAG: DinB family protein [Ignavibacteriales bacterium]|nr:DinB family protein [Ignavibacteriales bacterium]
MKETAEQYKARITGYVAGVNHFKVFQATPKKLAKLVKKATARKLNERPASDKWSVSEIVTHLAESELVIGYRLRLMLGSNGTPIQVVDQDAWQANARYLIKDTKEAFQLFEVLRANNVSLLKSLSREQWDYYGMHQERGKETIARVVEMYAGHDVNHMLQIEHILAPGSHETIVEE